jgi:SAM-dependent methyltransferase
MGHFLSVARDSGFDVLGIEPSEPTALRARERFGVEVVGDLVEHVDLAEGSFDVACMWHVLEHVAEPDDVLRRIRHSLRPSGLLFVEVPNYGSVRARVQGRRWQPLEPQFHVGQYSPKALSRLLVRTGFEIVSVTTVPFAVYKPLPRALLTYGRQAVILRGWPFGEDPQKHELLRATARVPTDERAEVDVYENRTSAPRSPWT